MSIDNRMNMTIITTGGRVRVRLPVVPRVGEYIVYVGRKLVAQKVTYEGAENRRTRRN